MIGFERAAYHAQNLRSASSWKIFEGAGNGRGGGMVDTNRADQAWLDRPGPDDWQQCSRGGVCAEVLLQGTMGRGHCADSAKCFYAPPYAFVFDRERPGAHVASHEPAVAAIAG